ncbi:MAG: AcrB/AcrD/AcrF family protein, partial [Sulfuricurvum sp.]|nr:AcrB/AcrD/AcrF family protein [Sulfuricurvum sp.]
MYKKFENYLLLILNTPSKKRMVLLGTLLAFILSVALIPTKLVLAKMLPGKNNDTYSVYIDLANGSSIEQTRQVSECVVGVLQHEKEALDTEVFLGSGSPLDFAGLIKGSHFKNSENVAEIVVNLTKKHHRDEPSYMMVQRLRPV